MRDPLNALEETLEIDWIRISFRTSLKLIGYFLDKT